MEIFWNDEEQCFYTIPDGDKATHKEIEEYYQNKIKKYSCITAKQERSSGKEKI